jgi:hypothetical protein
VSAPKEAFPLTWPVGWKRTLHFQRIPARFGTKGSGPGYPSKNRLTIAEATNRVRDSLQKMGHKEITISSNLALRNDGLPRSGQSAPDDPGVAVYWGVGAESRCIAVDQYDRVADNLGAIAATLEAMRAIERHGGAAILTRAFAGFTALPAPEQWFTVLGVSATATRREIDIAHRRLAMEFHPDRPDGCSEKMARINRARDEGIAAATRGEH